MKFNTVVCGGTFDHFHKGHEKFLGHAFSLGKKVVVGLTSDEYVKSSKFPTTPGLRGASKVQSSPQRPGPAPSGAGQGFEGQAKFIESYGKRKQAVLEFIKKERVLSRVKIVKIDDTFGPTLSKDFPIDAIVVSENTKKGAEYINRKRKELDLSPLKVLIVRSIKAKDGRLIASARIRNGEINREGESYINPLWFKKDLMLPENLRKEFKKPFGELFGDIDSALKDKDRCFLVVTVGDITTKIFNEKSLGQNMSIIDFKVAREKKFSNIQELGFTGGEKVFNVDNPAGYITSNLFKKIVEIFKVGIKNKIILQINGEEDLAVLPLVLFSPLNTIIYYGQPNEGVVKVVVSEESKEGAYRLVSKFEMLK